MQDGAKITGTVKTKNGDATLEVFLERGDFPRVCSRMVTGKVYHRSRHLPSTKAIF